MRNSNDAAIAITSRQMALGRRMMQAVGRRLPKRWRDERYRLRVFGPSDYLQNKWRHATRRAPVPIAGAPFEIGAPVPIVLHESTVKAIRSHWVDVGPGLSELQAFKRVARDHRAFLDIGAAQGIFSAAFCAMTGGQAYAFEPSPEMFGELAELIDKNPEFSISPFAIALGAVAGSQPVQPFGAQFRGVDGAQSEAATMSVETLDDFVAHHGLAPDFVKIDVEGMELEVLRGGEKTFTQSVDAIMLEVHPQMLMRGATISDLQAKLSDYGFAMFTLEFAPIPDLSTYLTNGRQALQPATNIVCAKSRLWTTG
ncbi:MAG: FkbM family methyltransferase [Solirubrobacteraceae bacterium]